MTIQKYTKFEDGRTAIQFREPTVRDCCQFDGLNPEREELATTEYLDHMQSGEVSPSIDWTVYDRRTAIFWIYILSRDDTTILQKYDCNHCGEEHRRPLELSELGQFMTEASRDMREPVTVSDKQGFIVPLRGYAMEHLEQLATYRDSIDDMDSQEYREADHECFLYRIAHQLEFDSEDEELSRTERAEARLDFLLDLPPKLFRPLVANVRQVTDEMRHGLECEIRDGQVLLVTPEHECPNTEGFSTSLMMPFHLNDFLPSF